MGSSPNPYFISGPVTTKEGFYGRKNTLNWVTTELNNPALKLLLLHGRRQVGKSSFLHYLAHTLPEDTFLTVYFALAPQPLDALTTDLASTSIAK
jgi:predicted AAA+ superfamily ATPase